MASWGIEVDSPIERRKSRLPMLLSTFLVSAGLWAQNGSQAQQPQSAAPAKSNSAPAGQDPTGITSPLAIVPLDNSIPGAAASVTGPIKASNGRAFITSSGEIAAGSQTVHVTLPYRGTLDVCVKTDVKLSADTSVPLSSVPGLMMALQSGALEASFAVVKDSDIVQTPDFRILISGPGSADVKVRLGPKGDTCVDNPGANGPYVLVSSVFEGGVYRVQPGQRVMFQHGSLHEVVDNEKEPCGCPPATTAGNEFPLAQSEGLALTPKPPAPETDNKQAQKQAEAVPPLVYMGAKPEAKSPPEVQPSTQPEAAPPPKQPAPTPPQQKKPGFFRRVGHFFKRVFGAES
jgi:hypothetical protein